MKMFGTWNLDVKNYAPYMTMNMFNPSEKTYDDSAPGQILKLLDKAPVLQTPVGQVLKDYWLQPWILSGTDQVPQGQFGQAIMPYYDDEGKRIDPTLRSKAFYGGRTFLESLVPGGANYLGLPLGWAGISPEATEYIPSYGIRSIIGGTQGRSSLGNLTKQDAVRKTLQTLLGRSGIPAYSLDTTKTTNRK